MLPSHTLSAKRVAITVLMALVATSALVSQRRTVVAGPPADNPVATLYSGDMGYPAWTSAIRWGNVIDMSVYAEGRNTE